MRERFTILIALICLVVGLRIPRAFAYDNQTTHPALTDEIIDFYNSSFSANQLTPEEKEQVVQGSILEDTPPRWINHFYDPIYNVGWSGEKVGEIPAEAIQILSRFALSFEKPISAVEWANNSLIQNEYRLYEGDRTWKKALEYYANGDKVEAYKTLGFILHLLEDMSVPEHTRNDTHAQEGSGLTGDTASPYESYATQWTRTSIKERYITENLKNGGTPAVSKPRVEDYLLSLAEYSNKYFFSKDTINDLKYQNPKIIKDDGNFGYGKDEDEKEFKLVKSAVVNTDGEIKTSYSILSREEYYPILDAYFSRLSRQAVLHGAGLIHLFQQQAEDAIVNKEFPTHLVKYDFSQLTLPVVSLYGTWVKVQDAASGFFASLSQATQLAISSAGSFFAVLFGGSEEAATPPSATSVPPPSEEVPAGAASQPEATGGTEEGEAVVPAGEVSAETQSAGEPPLSLADIQAQILAISRQIEVLRSQIDSLQSASPASVGQPASTLVAVGGGGGGGTSAVALGGDASSGSASTPQEANPTSTPTSTPPAVAHHVVISEILFNAAGSDVGKEFVELYNPTTSTVDLTSWSLKYEKGTSTTPLATFKAVSHPEDQALIPARGFLLVGLNSYDAANYGRTADIVRTASLPNGASRVEVVLSSSDRDEMDRVSYAAGSLVAEGESLERKAWESTCTSPQGIGEFLGNACDTDGDSDFEVRDTPNPQNSAGLPEPRTAPAALLPPGGASGIATFETSTVTIAFAWQPSADAEGATSTVRYAIFEVDASGTALIAETTSTAHSFAADPTGRAYEFALRAFDRDGLGSATTTVAVATPDLLLTIQMVTTDESTPSWGNDNWYQLGNGFHGILYTLTLEGRVNDVNYYASHLTLREYLDPNYTQLNRSFVISDNAPFIPTSTRVTVSGLNISLQPNKYYRLDTFQEWQNRSVILKGTTATGTAMYNDIGGGIGRSRVEYTYAFYPYLTAIMAKNYPPLSPPEAPPNLSLDFDSFNLRVTASWASSTDADTGDNLISYEVNYASSTELAADGWQSVGRAHTFTFPVVFPSSYLFGVRARDDFGALSVTATIPWSFPAGLVPLPLQTEHDNGLAGGAQRIVLGGTATLDGIELWVGPISGWYNHSDSYAAVLEDASGTPGTLLAASALVTLGQYEVPHAVLYSFAPLALPAGAYWIGIGEGPPPTNSTRIYGSTRDAYPDGFWSADPGVDAYFRLHPAP